jgi:hypothetical protein
MGVGLLLAPYAMESLDDATKLADSVAHHLLDERAIERGVLGAGVQWLPDSGIVDRQFAATVFVRDENAHAALLGSIRAGQLPWLQELLSELDVDPDLVAAVRLSMPSWEVGPGHVSIGENTGTLGFRVHETTMAGGRFDDSVLTAGHVAQRPRLDASVSGETIGTVHRLFIPQPRQEIGADVALIRATYDPSHLGALNVVGAVGVLPGDEVVIHLHTGDVPARIHADANWFLFKDVLIYRRVYLTEKHVTSAGDSGAPVTTGGRHAIGHVVGASAGRTTYIQGILIQLEALEMDPDISTVKLA